MEDVWEEPSEQSRVSNLGTNNPERLPIAQKFKALQDELAVLKREKESKEQSTPFKFPFKWNWKFRQARRKSNLEKVLILFLNKKNEIEPPIFVPIYSGNIIVYKNKAYEFDPRGIWRMKGVRGYPSVYLIREIDRRPLTNPNTGKYIRDKRGRLVYSKDAAVSNLDIDEVRARGDSTESDEFLIKAALKAYTASKPTANVNWVVIAVVIVIVCVGLYFLSKGNLGA